jgi:hypothetical protein
VHKRIGSHLARNTIAYVALFFALTGGAVAAATALPRNSVGTLQVKDRSLLAKDFKLGQLPKGPAGPAGPAGAAGAAGPAGPAGPAGASGAAANFTVKKVTVAGGGGGFTTVTAVCPSGSKLVSGGFEGRQTSTSPVTTSRPGKGAVEGAASSDAVNNGEAATAWTVTQYLSSAGNVTAFAICAA